MDKKVLITRDSTSDLTAEIIDSLNIKTVPLGITLDNQTYLDGVDIDPDFIYKYHEEHGVLPKTSAANIADMIEFFKPYVEEGYEIVHFTISSKMSSTYQNSLLAAKEFDGVYVVDTGNLSTGEGLLIMKAAEMAKEGKSAKEIYDEIMKIRDNVDASFVVDTLEYLHKGGRCSSIAALGANLLKLRPMIQVKDGKMSVAKKYRGKMNEVLKQYTEERLAVENQIVGKRIFVTHSGGCEEIAEELKSIVSAKYPDKEVLISRAGCTVSTHCGPGTLGVLMIRESAI